MHIFKYLAIAAQTQDKVCRGIILFFTGYLRKACLIICHISCYMYASCTRHLEKQDNCVRCFQ